VSDSQPWGTCAAFGCPLLGTMGSDGNWYCFCHVGKPSVFNDAITRELRENQAEVVAVTLAIRRDTLGATWSPEAVAATKALKSHLKGGELAFSKAKDIGARSWLLRLERHLIESTADIGTQARIASTVPTAKVIGPTQAAQHFSEAATRLIDRAEERQ
jgi:hypothetical protein